MVDIITGISPLGMSGVQESLRNDTAKAESFERALNTAVENREDAEIMRAAREFESYFLQMMLKEMRKTVPRDGLFPKSRAEEIFEGMLDEETAKNAADAGGIGLAQLIYDQMTRGKTAVPPSELASGESDEGTEG